LRRAKAQKVKNLIAAQSEEKLITRCAPGEWTIKEILVHIIDTERIFAYRALRFARNDRTELPGWEQDPNVAWLLHRGPMKQPIYTFYTSATAHTLRENAAHPHP
jgi:uncharacterized damage-inducible protein DinB